MSLGNDTLSQNTACYPAHLTPDRYTQPKDQKKARILSQYIDEYTGDTSDFVFDYIRGSYHYGTFGTYDLTKGLFTCFNPLVDEVDDIKATIDSHFTTEKHNSFRALIL